MFKKFLAVGVGAIAITSIALVPAGVANARPANSVTAVVACPATGPDVTTSVTVAPGQSILWNVTGCDKAYWDSLTGPTAFRGNVPETIGDPYSITTPANTFVCGADQMEFELTSASPGGFYYVDILCGTAAPATPSSPASLAHTGANSTAIMSAGAVAAALLGAGALALLMVRRRRSARK